jgi:L-histidine N-alpha-methyltransferase
MNIKTAVLARRHDSTFWRKTFQSDVIDGLTQPRKQIPCKYFYDAIGSALFDEICDLDEYYLTRSELEILHSHAPEMAEAIGEDCELVEFGSGSGLKTRLLLAQVVAPRAYLPVDIAGEQLERSVRDLSADFPEIRLIPVHADFANRFRLPGTGRPKARRVVYFPGSTIGNFNPAAAVDLLRRIVRLLGRGGGLLIGFDLDKNESIVWPAYNDRQGTSAAFNLNLLARINRELAADFDLAAFSHRADYLRARERVEMHLESRRAQVVHVAGRTIAFAAGETIHTEDSYKYSLETFSRLTSQAGFALSRQWLDSRGYFAVQFLVVP